MNLTAALTAVRALVAKYPARIISATAAVVVFAAAKLGFVLPKESVLHALEAIVPLIVAGEATHHVVTPVATLAPPVVVAPVAPSAPATPPLT